MKYYGVERRVDKFGRIVIPKEFRKVLDLKPDDIVESILVEIDGEKVVMIKKGKQ